MPQTNVPKKKLGVLTWIVIALVVFATLAMIKSALFKSKTSTVESGFGLYAEDLAAPGAPERQRLAESSLVVKEFNSSDSAAPVGESAKLVQRVIKTGELSIRVQDTPKAMEDVKRIALSKNGYIESSSISDDGTSPRSGVLTVRVPAASFEQTLSELKALGVLVLSESVHGQDVTMQYVDLEADLKNARAEEASYLEIMKRSGKIEEVLMVTERLANVRGRIERLDGQKRYLENQTDLATITVSLTEETKIEIPSKTWQPYEVLRSSIREIVSALQALVDLLIRLVIGFIGLFIPIAFLVASFTWLIWKIIKTVLKRLQK